MKTLLVFLLTLGVNLFVNAQEEYVDHIPECKRISMNDLKRDFKQLENRMLALAEVWENRITALEDDIEFMKGQIRTIEMTLSGPPPSP